MKEIIEEAGDSRILQGASACVRDIDGSAIE